MRQSSHMLILWDETYFDRYSPVSVRILLLSLLQGDKLLPPYPPITEPQHLMLRGWGSEFSVRKGCGLGSGQVDLHDANDPTTLSLKHTPKDGPTRFCLLLAALLALNPKPCIF